MAHCGWLMTGTPARAPVRERSCVQVQRVYGGVLQLSGNTNTLLTLSVNSELTGNPTTGRTLTRGLIEVVSSLPTPGCNAAAVSPKAGIRGWLTHPEAVGPNGQYSVSVEQLTESTPGPEELNTLVLECEILSTLSVGQECGCDNTGR